MLVTITYLQMFKPPMQPDIQLPEPLTVMRSMEPTVAFYRYLYNSVGAPWHWLDRRRWSDSQLLQELRQPQLELWVLYHQGTPAGYCELLQNMDEVQLSYFGLMPEYVGRGLGRLWLGWSLHQAWRRQPARVWLHTCDQDHPAALPLYQKLGLVPYYKMQEVRNLEDAGETKF